MIDPRTAPLEVLQQALGGPQPCVDVRIIPGVFSPNLCRALAREHEAAETRKSGFMWGPDEIVRPDVKSRNDHYLDADQSEYVADILRGNGLPAPFERHLVARYDAPAGHFAAHRDDVFPGTQHRKWAVSINLNDDFEGGHLDLPECGATIRAPMGAAVVFAASTLHSVAPVTAGRRYAYLTFF